jgi:glycosyltransferase involved in cell wall biosynthesis
MDQDLEQPLVSINIATYNRGNFIVEAIESVLTQTFTDWELIIVDDASTDGTKAVIAPFLKDPRIKYFRNDVNLNISLTRNRGLEESRGEFIAILDSDDLWSDKQKLAEQVDFLKTHPDHALVGTGVIKIDIKGNEITRFQNPLTDHKIRSTILAKNPFAQSSLLYRRKAALDAGGYNPSINGIEDYDLWLKIGLKWRFANLPGYFLKYRVHGSNISLTDRQRLMKINLDLIQTNRNNYPNYASAFLRRWLRFWVYKITRILF